MEFISCSHQNGFPNWKGYYAVISPQKKCSCDYIKSIIEYLKLDDPIIKKHYKIFYDIGFFIFEDGNNIRYFNCPFLSDYRYDKIFIDEPIEYFKNYHIELFEMIEAYSNEIIYIKKVERL